MRCNGVIFLLLLIIICSLKWTSTVCLGSTCVDKSKVIISDIVSLNGELLEFLDNTVIIVRDGGGFYNGKIKGKKIKIESGNNVIFRNGVETMFEESELKSYWYDNLYSCIKSNYNCSIYIYEGEYVIDDTTNLRIHNSLYGIGNVTIKHKVPFSITDHVIIEGIKWDGQDNSNYWMYCQPNNLIVRNCAFCNYFGKSAGIIYWSHSERDTDGLLVENCYFGRLGVYENGKVGDMYGSSAAIYTYRCKNVIIRKNIFEKQYGEEDSDAIKLEGAIIQEWKKWPLATGENYRYDGINAIIEENEFSNVPKSPIKIFASNVKVFNNRINSNRPVKTALVRLFRCQDVVIDKNKLNCSVSVSNVIEIYACKNIKVRNNKLTCENKFAEAFGELLRIEASEKIAIDRLSVSFLSSSEIDLNQTLLRLSGKDISITNTHFKTPYTYYGIYAPFGVDGLFIDNCSFEVNKKVQYPLLINNVIKEPIGSCMINHCTFAMANEVVNDNTSYGAVFADTILITDCKFYYDKGITINADRVDVYGSDIYGLNIQNALNISIVDSHLRDTYTPIIIGNLKSRASLTMRKVSTGNVHLALIRYQSNLPTYLSMAEVISPGIEERRLFHFDDANALAQFEKKNIIKNIDKRIINEYKWNSNKY